MRTCVRSATLALVCGLVAGGPHSSRVHAQLPTDIPQVHFSRGQDIVPYFEGWIRNPDGTFDMVFGYFNRNWQEELAIAPGPDNVVEPGGPDRGQPTYFLPRRQPWVFRVRVPADWGNKALTWTITAHGRTEKAYGELLPVEEITERIIMTRGSLNPGDDDPNKPPTISIAPVPAANPASPLTLTALVSDDGLPRPSPAKARQPPSADGTFLRAQANSSAVRRSGLSVTWLQYRGPAKVTFTPAGRIAVENGKAIATARFTEPGIYELRADASDGALSTRASVTVTVSAVPSTQGKP